MLFSFFAVFLMIALNLAIPICIAVYVYQDAKRRGMEPILWALVAAIVPWFIGLIIYLLVRSGHSAPHCCQVRCICGGTLYGVPPVRCGAEIPLSVLRPICAARLAFMRLLQCRAACRTFGGGSRAAGQ